MVRNLKFIIIYLISIHSLVSHAGLIYNYHQLALKNLDQVNALVKEKIKESKQAYSGKTVPLKEALQAIYSRPNTDDMISKIADSVRSKLDDEGAYETVFEELINEAINALRNTSKFKRDVQVTYAIFLENTLSEFKPELKKKGFEFKMIEKIANASLELSKEARKERELRLMSEGTSPSVIAKKILDDFSQAEASTAAQASKTSEEINNSESNKTESEKK